MPDWEVFLWNGFDFLLSFLHVLSFISTFHHGMMPQESPHQKTSPWPQTFQPPIPWKVNLCLLYVICLRYSFIAAQNKLRHHVLEGPYIGGTMEGYILGLLLVSVSTLDFGNQTHSQIYSSYIHACLSPWHYFHEDTSHTGLGAHRTPGWPQVKLLIKAAATLLPNMFTFCCTKVRTSTYAFQGHDSSPNIDFPLYVRLDPHFPSFFAPDSGK